MVAYLPTFLLEVGVQMDYVVAQIFTVTLYYINCVVDPVIYFYANPSVQMRVSRSFSKKVSGHTLPGSMRSTQMQIIKNG